MATVAILVDFYAGHLYPTFYLAKALRNRGHHVCYLGISDIESRVRVQGFEFHAIMTDLFPPGTAQKLREAAGFDLENQRLMELAQIRYMRQFSQGKVLEKVLVDIQPDVMLVPSFFTLEALVVRYRHGVPVVFLAPYIRGASREQACKGVVQQLMDLRVGGACFIEMFQQCGVKLKGLEDIARLLFEIDELILYPRCFELPGREPDAKMHHLGATVDAVRSEEEFAWERFHLGMPLIYCSLGSQPDVYGDIAVRFFDSVIASIAAQPDWQMAISTGSYSPTAVPDLDQRILMRKWLPQMSILSGKCDLMITHGGLGTVKECIMSAVPMIVYPIMSDQVECAWRVEHFGMGLKGDIYQISAGDVAHKIAQVLNERRFREQTNLMRERFRAEDNVIAGVEIIERNVQRVPITH